MAPRKDDPYDCISMQQGPATEKGLVNAEMLAALPHKKQADPPQDTKATDIRKLGWGRGSSGGGSGGNRRYIELNRELMGAADAPALLTLVSCPGSGPVSAPAEPVRDAAALPLPLLRC